MENTTKLTAMTTRFESFRLTHQHSLTLSYFVLLLLPFVIAESLGMLTAGVYHTVLTVLNLLAMMAFFVQFPLAGRLKRLPLFSHIDWAMTKHKQWGKYLGIFFFLHPFLILAPKLLVSVDDLGLSFISVLTESQLLTGLIAWAVMAVWVLMSIYKDKLSLTYERWRLLHVIGFMTIATLATLHVTTVGSHGQYNTSFNTLWWCLYILCMGLTVYNYLIKPRLIRQHAFTVQSISKISERDWQLSLEKHSPQAFTFSAGQFVWLNTSGSVYSLQQHPFSIVSEENTYGQLSFIIRELGDYTKKLASLNVGQSVLVDGPYGNLSLAQTRTARGLIFIAGGAGIAPMMGLIRELAKQHDPRPIHLLYANQTLANMVCLDELIVLQHKLKHFKLHLFCEHLDGCAADVLPYVQTGVIDQLQINAAMETFATKTDWAIYHCGPKGMIKATNQHLKAIGINANQIHFEQLSF